MMKKKTRVITELAVLLCLSVIIGGLERFIPLSVPGAKIGLSNVALMAALVRYGKKEYLLLGTGKVLLCATLFGNFGVSFILSLSGFVTSAIIILIISSIDGISIYTLSVIGALCHISGQTLTATLIYRNIGMLYYLPILLCVCYISGLLVGFISKCIVKIMKKLS